MTDQGRWVVVWSKEMGAAVFGWELVPWTQAHPNGFTLTLAEARWLFANERFCDAAEAQVLALALTGPDDSDDPIVQGPLVQLTLVGVTAVAAATPAAVAVWRGQPQVEAQPVVGQPAAPRTGEIVHVRAPGEPLLTERQFKAIMAIGRTLGWSSAELIGHCRNTFGCEPAALTKLNASKFIDGLQQLVQAQPRCYHDDDVPF